MESITSKAIELMDKYWELNVDDKAPVFTEKCKQCAIIAINEVIKALEEHQWQNRNTIEDYKQMKLEVEKL